MQTDENHILTINGGSSSIKFSIYTEGINLQLRFSGKIERIGRQDASLIFSENQQQDKRSSVAASDISEAADSLINWLNEKNLLTDLSAIGHRIVHGMQVSKSQRITIDLLDALQKIISYDPDHLPGEIALIRRFQKRLPEIPQVACFDTAFHAGIPRLARLLPIPLKFEKQGIIKYGFHGLSYSFILEELNRIGEPAAKRGRLIVAHLGNGASVAAILDGRCIDTSMGFTPTGGMMMGSRTGDIDPGIVRVIMDANSMNATKFNDFVNHDCGLLGVSEISSDMQDLLKKESSDMRARDAVDVFCYQAKKWIGSFAAVLGGLDVLVFTGGIGEHAFQVRQRICEGLGFLGIDLNQKLNKEGAQVISSKESRGTVYVIPTNEEIMIVKEVISVLTK